MVSNTITTDDPVAWWSVCELCISQAAEFLFGVETFAVRGTLYVGLSMPKVELLVFKF